MHIYICPYCDPCPKARLIKIKSEHLDCKYDKEETCKEIHKCKDIMKCNKCKSEFKIDKAFRKAQKRKLKDG